MATGKALDGKPYAGNPHVRFDEGDVALAKPRRGALLHRLRTIVAGLSITALLPMELTAYANVLPEDSFWNKDTAYVPASPAQSEAKALEADENFIFTSIWDLTLLFATDFCGNPAKGFFLFFQ